jgi:hypothetical protein
MALPDYLKVEQGTAVIWGHTGGSGVTAVMDVNALADAAGWMGASVDLGAQWDEEYAVILRVETGTAPTGDGTKVVELYLAYDNTNWPGKVTGSNAAYPATIASNKRQLGGMASILIATADTNTILRQQAVIWRPKARYVAPVLVNLLGQAFRNQGTPADNGTRVILVPRRLLVQDAA